MSHFRKMISRSRNFRNFRKSGNFRKFLEFPGDSGNVQKGNSQHDSAEVTVLSDKLRIIRPAAKSVPCAGRCIAAAKPETSPKP